MGKKIEPTDAMVEAGASYAWEETNPGILGWNSISEHHKKGCRRDARAVLAAALNHPDARGLFADEDALRAAREQGWDQATLWIDSYQGGPNGRTDSARSANPYRPAQELPTENGAVIVPAEGHEYIEIRAGKKSRRLTWDADAFVWYDAYGTYLGTDITTVTWKVADQ